MGEYKHKSHNVSVLKYHFVCQAKYRRAVIDEEVKQVIRGSCEEISKRYEIDFLEIGMDREYAHFLVQSVPMYSPKKIIQIIKSIIAREVLEKCPRIKGELWGGGFWADGYYVVTVGEDRNEQVVEDYVNKRGLGYKRLYRKSEEGRQYSLFDYM